MKNRAREALDNIIKNSNKRNMKQMKHLLEKERINNELVTLNLNCVGQLIFWAMAFGTLLGIIYIWG